MNYSMGAFYIFGLHPETRHGGMFGIGSKSYKLLQPRFGVVRFFQFIAVRRYFLVGERPHGSPLNRYAFSLGIAVGVVVPCAKQNTSLAVPCCHFVVRRERYQRPDFVFIGERRVSYRALKQHIGSFGFL